MLGQVWLRTMIVVHFIHPIEKQRNLVVVNFEALQFRVRVHVLVEDVVIWWMHLPVTHWEGAANPSLKDQQLSAR